MALNIQSTTVNPTPKYRNNLLESGLMFLAAILLIFFIVKPKYSAVTLKSTELTSAQSQFQSVENDSKTMTNLIAKMNSSKESLDLVDQALPLTGRVTQLNLLIDNLVATAGMQLASISNDDSSTDTVVSGDKALLADPYSADRKLHTSLASITVTGPIEQFRQLLKLIETNPRLIDVSSVSIVSQEGAIIYKVGLKAYYYSPEYAKTIQK